MDAFDDRGQPLDDGELDEVARLLLGPLPADYRAFMSAGHGGLFRDPNRYASSRHGGLNELFALRDDSPSYWTFAAALAIYRGRVPRGFAPIGDDLAGNLIVLGLDGEHDGKVFFWEHEQESDPPAMGNMELLADSFVEFLSSIRVEDT